MKSMQTLVIELIDADWSQKQIAEATGLGANTISRIYRGHTQAPDWRGKKRLVELHARVVGDQ